MRRMNPFPHVDAPLLGGTVRAAALFGLLTVAGCGSDGLGSVDFAAPPDVAKIGVSPRSKPAPGTRAKRSRAPSKKPVQIIPG
jgi:hypothetical protein